MVLTCFNPSNKIVISTNHPKYGWTTTILWTQLEHMVAMVARNGICSQMTGHFVKSINGGFLNKMGLIIPKSSISMDFFHYKPSIWGYPHLWKSPTQQRNTPQWLYTFSFACLGLLGKMGSVPLCPRCSNQKDWDLWIFIIFSPKVKNNHRF